MNDQTPKDPPNTNAEVEANFPVVGIGASAGGLDAFEKFFTHTPPNTGIAFVIVQHLDPDHKSMLVDLIQRFTSMTVVEVTDVLRLQPNHVYIIPPNKDLALLHRKLHLLEPDTPRGHRLPIDFFFRSLAEDLRDQAICIVLSGTGSDGTLGLKAIKEVGGLTIVQDPETAKYDGMPNSAIATELADLVLPPEAMVAQLIAYIQHTSHIEKSNPTTNISYDADALEKIFIVLRAETGHDFSQYKKNTIVRRVERRMAVNQIDSFKHYVRYLRHNHLEVNKLFKDLLIGVTRFFRDTAAFDVLEQQIIPTLFADRPPEEAVRVWVCGCSTGEEAYSIAMLLSEYVMSQGLRNRIQIFATDIDEQNVEKARLGTYPDSIAADISPQRLERFFTADNNTYQVNAAIRDMVVFASQNVIKDPPFSRIDLISCRNLLIYLDVDLQRQLIPLFHYALNLNGFLFLGTSETLGEHHQLFDTVDRKQKIFRRANTLAPVQPVFTFPQSASTPHRFGNDQDTPINLRDVAENILLNEHVPVAIIINAKGEILYTHGRTGKYLEISTGELSRDVLKLAREGLRIPLSTAVRRVMTNRQPMVEKLLEVQTNGDTQPARLTVKPIYEPPAVRGLYLILIEALQVSQEDDESKISAYDQQTSNQRIAELEQDLTSTRQYLQTTIEELETSNEELKSTNEELQSSNEELQSTNEELETTKEELQSINEELLTVNAELENKIDELSLANNDLSNLLASIGIAIVFLDIDLNIQRFNPSAAELINLIDSDIGRSITHIVTNFEYDHFTRDANRVLDTLQTLEAEVHIRDGRWFMMRMRPYRTVENVIAGVIVTFAEITQQKIVQEELTHLNDVIEEAYTLVIVTGPSGTIEYVNGQYERTFGYTDEEVIGRHFLFNSVSPAVGEDNALWDVLRSGEIWRGEIEFLTKQGEEIVFLVAMLPVRNQAGTIRSYLLIHDNITTRHRMEMTLRRSEKLYRTLARRLPGVAILVFDRNLRYLVAEGASLEQAGYRREEIEGRSFYDVIPEDRRAQLEPLYRATLNGEERTLTYTSLNGLTFDLQAVPLNDDAEENMGGMLVIHRVEDE